MKTILRVSLFMVLLSLPVGAKDKAPAAGQKPSTSAPSTPGDTDQATRPPENDLFQPDAQEPTLSKTAGPEDPLKIGGVFYLRMLSDARQGQKIRDYTFSTPMLVDTYLDVRPNDRVHGELVGRITYDPTGNSFQNIMMSVIPPSTTSSASTTTPTPQFILNQLWIRFDIARTVFVSAGKQNTKWGSAHFWNPTDFLQPVRNPLEPFDIRTGTTMLKFHLPWEKYGWNFYAVGLFEKPAPIQSLNGQIQNQSTQFTTFTLGNLGGAVRAEFVVSTFEIGADFVTRYGQRPKYGFDLSAGLDSLLKIPVDIYAEVALRHGSDTTRFRPVAEQPTLIDVFIDSTKTKTYNPNEITPQVSCGLNWSTMYNDQDMIIVGAEYFYNSLGYNDINIYPYLINYGAFQPFYIGKHYAALFVSLPNPGSWDNTTFTLSSIGNLSDKSFVIRLDYSVQVLTYLRVEAYIAGYLGQAGGEFRFRFDTNDLHEKDPSIPLIKLPVPIIDVGVSLRIDI